MRVFLYIDLTTVISLTYAAVSLQFSHQLLPLLKFKEIKANSNILQPSSSLLMVMSVFLDTSH